MSSPAQHLRIKKQKPPREAPLYLLVALI